ncbi:MAG: Omp28-related outer membrane protein [Bacteroidales bacterium]|nr:Omp28-related outer membrane protein [Bacteroidales bacterium]
MKKIFFYSILLSFVFLTFNCDKIDKPYITREYKLDTPDFPALTQVIQKYLLEDFTAHLCVNCPQAHVIADELKNEMGDTLVVMAIHTSGQARPQPSPYEADYRTEIGDAIATEFAVEGLPKGMISRKVFDGNRVMGRTQWKTNMAKVLRQTPCMGIQILTSARCVDSINVFVKITSFIDINRNLKLYIMLTENGLVSAQKNNSSLIGSTPDILDYQHKHVLRTHIGPIEGSRVATQEVPFKKDESLIKGHTLYLKGKSWKLDKCDIIAYVIDEDTKEILQVEEIGI